MAGTALYGAITLKNGRVQQNNFHNYKLLAMRDMPVVETHVVPSTEPPTGAGEPPTPPTPPALVNAIYDDDNNARHQRTHQGGPIEEAGLIKVPVFFR